MLLHSNPSAWNGQQYKTIIIISTIVGAAIHLSDLDRMMIIILFINSWLGHCDPDGTGGSHYDYSDF